MKWEEHRTDDVADRERWLKERNEALNLLDRWVNWFDHEPRDSYPVTLHLGSIELVERRREENPPSLRERTDEIALRPALRMLADEIDALKGEK